MWNVQMTLLIENMDVKVQVGKLKPALLFLSTLTCCLVLFSYQDNLMTTRPNNIHMFASSDINYNAEIMLAHNAERTQIVTVSKCNCTKAIVLNNDVSGSNFSLKQTTCSLESYLRGNGQKVVSFTFFENIRSKNNEKYHKRKYLQVSVLKCCIHSRCKSYLVLTFDMLELRHIFL